MEANCMARVNGGCRGTAGEGETARAGERREQGERRVQTSSIRIGTVGFGVFAKTHGKLSATSPYFLPLVITILPRPTVCVAPYRPISYRW